MTMSATQHVSPASVVPFVVFLRRHGGCTMTAVLLATLRCCNSVIVGVVVVLLHHDAACHLGGHFIVAVELV
jgi:hypothetical protein